MVSKRSKAADHRRRRGSLMQRHGLSVIVLGIVLLWLALYTRSDPSTHLGAFFGNATADWTGTLLLVIATKYFFEVGSAESRPPHPSSRGPAMRFFIDHSLTILILLTGAAWVALYLRLPPDGKTGQVVGNIVSEWSQALGIVVITKYARERGSHEG